MSVEIERKFLVTSDAWRAAAELFPLCLPPLIEKTRHLVTHAGHTWEVDEFHGENEGLVVAELELPSESTLLEQPSWLGSEVSADHRYSNSWLSAHPFRTWDQSTAHPHATTS